MKPGLIPEASDKPVSFASAEKLAEHLREHPEAVGHSPAYLAEHFDLPESFTATFLDQLKNPVRREEYKKQYLQDAWAGMLDFGRFLAGIFAQLTQKPVAFVAVTSVLMAVLCATYAILGQNNPFESGARITFTLDGPLGGIILVSLALQMACYFRHAMGRYAWLGGATVFGISLPIALIEVLREVNLQRQENLAGRLALVLLAVLTLSAFYALAALAASIAGGLYRLRREEAAEGQLSRQQLLDRLLAIRDRLERAEDAVETVETSWWENLMAAYSRRPFIYAAAVGLLAGSLELLGVGGVSYGQGQAQLETSGLVDAVRTMFLLADTAAMVATGFYAGSVRKSIVAVWIYQMLSLLPLWVPFGIFGPEYVQDQLAPARLAGTLIFGAVFGGVAGQGARVEERAAMSRRLWQNDPAALLAEMVRIQWRIAPETRNVCVMVVDAARSSRMKAEVDPFVAEWSFREYQQFIQSVAARWEGDIHATAGDGAVVAFRSPNEAFAAARAIQREIDAFNRNVSRLKSPFRLRIGLHMGELQGDLDEVEFTEVIDIAAHIQETAPVGGIAMSERVADSLEGERLARMRDMIDGWPIVLALNPTGD